MDTEGIMQRYGLIGQSLNHSFSKSYFSQKFLDLQIEADYQNLEFNNIEEVVEELGRFRFDGFNVTIPYKEKIIPFLNEIDKVSSQIGAVNTVKKINGQWKGFNTDVYGFKQMIKPFFESHHERAVILGTGGASKAVEYVLEELGCDVIFISRNPKLNNHFSYAEVNEQMLRSCPIIINTTPVGSFPNVSQQINIPYQFLDSRNLLIDLVYNPKETLFLKQGRINGANTVNGLTMLHQQAEKSWEIWQSYS